MNDQNDPFSAERMQIFLAGLAGSAPEEVAKAKALYVKNAISDYRLMRESMAAMGCVQVVFWVIPIFWPFLIMQRRVMRAGEQRMRERVQNALAVWGDDIRATGIDVGKF
ncbi:MAG: hypothetical protein ACYS8X_03405 [Planctomycetota bacterium]